MPIKLTETSKEVTDAECTFEGSVSWSKHFAKRLAGSHEIEDTNDSCVLGVPLRPAVCMTCLDAQESYKNILG